MSVVEDTTHAGASPVYLWPPRRSWGRISLHGFGPRECVSCAADVSSFARDRGLPIRECRVIAVCVTELLTHTLRHAERGELFVEVQWAPIPQFVIEVRDRRLGLLDREAARAGRARGARRAREPFWGEESVGIGLGAVMRLMDKVVIRPREGGGAHITAVKWL